MEYNITIKNTLNLGMNAVNILLHHFISRFNSMTIFPMTLSDPIIRNDIKRVIRFHTYILESKKLFHSEWT